MAIISVMASTSSIQAIKFDTSLSEVGNLYVLKEARSTKERVAPLTGML